MKNTWDYGEVIAIQYLQKHDYTIKDTNFKFGRFWEIDLIVEKSWRYYFIEVKYRRNEAYWIPEDSITPYKLRKCLKTVDFYCKKYWINFENIQFDVLAIQKLDNFHRVKHYKNIEL